MSTSSAQPKTISPTRPLNTILWIIQGLLALTFIGTSVWKFATPIPQLAAMIPWAGQVTPGLLYATAAFDLLGGIGVVAPTITRVKPALAVVAALGCAALQVAAIVFHFSRGEQANTPFNFVMVGLALFVAWGRRATYSSPSH